MNDPYPQNLADVDEAELGFAPASPAQSTLLRAVTALERIAAALENRPQPVQNAPRPNLTPLPPIGGNAVEQRPSCPFHGSEKVRASTNGKGGFYCSAKGGPNPNPKGYCTWHS